MPLKIRISKKAKDRMRKNGKTKLKLRIKKAPKARKRPGSWGRLA